MLRSLAAEPAAHRRLYGAVRGHWRWSASGRPATLRWSAAFLAACAGAPSPIDLVRAVAHPVLEVDHTKIFRAKRHFFPT